MLYNNSLPEEESCLCKQLLSFPNLFQPALMGIQTPSSKVQDVTWRMSVAKGTGNKISPDKETSSGYCPREDNVTKTLLNLGMELPESCLHMPSALPGTDWHDQSSG